MKKIKTENRRFLFFYILGGVFFAAILLKLYSLQIVNGEEKQEEKPDIFTKLLTKLLEFWSKVMYVLFGGKGISDIILFR